MTRAVVLVSLLLSGCISIPGTEEGGPCNAQGVCVAGLACDIENNVCVAPEAVAWEEMRTPAATTLSAVWGFNENDLFAVGSNGTVLRYQGDGIDWTEDAQAKAALAGTQSLNDISGRADELWAVGYKVILHYRAGRWTKQKAMDYGQSPAKELSSYDLNAVSASADFVVAVGSTSYSNNCTFQPDGEEWLPGASLPYEPQDLTILGQQVFIVGEAKQVRLYDGKAQTWLTKNLDDVVALKGIWGRTADDVWAVGPSKTLLHYDGSSWSTTNPGDLPAVAAIAGTANGDFYLAGSAGGYSSNYASVHHCTASGTCSPAPLTAEKTSSSKALKGVWCSDDGATVIVVGENGAVYRRKR